MFKYMCACAHYCVTRCLFLFAGPQGCSESRAAAAAYSRINVAVRRLGAFLNCHGVHLHHPQLPPGRDRRRQGYTNAHMFS